MSDYVPSAGHPMKYAVAVDERRRIIRALTLKGHSAADIARRLGICNRTVVRVRKLLGVSRQAKRSRVSRPDDGVAA